MLALLTQRASLVEQIANGGASKRTLAMTLPLSRSTVTRAIQDLATVQLIRKDGNTYALTVRGRIAYREFRRTVTRYRGLIDARDLLDQVPETTALPGVVFEDATVIQPAPPTPDRPRTRFLDHVHQGEKIVGMGIIINQRLVEVFHNQLTAHDLQLSLLLDEQVIEHLWHAHYDRLCTALQIDHCTLQSVEQTPPFSLAIIDWTEIWLGVYNDCGQLQGILRTESSAAVEWAEQRLQEYAERATPIVSKERSLKQKNNSRSSDGLPE